MILFPMEGHTGTGRTVKPQNYADFLIYRQGQFRLLGEFNVINSAPNTVIDSLSFVPRKRLISYPGIFLQLI
jgi:hypothetical protein